MSEPLRPVAVTESKFGLQAELVAFAQSRLWVELLKPKLTAELERAYNELNGHIEGAWKNAARNVRITEKTILLKKIIKYVDNAESKIPKA